MTLVPKDTTTNIESGKRDSSKFSGVRQQNTGRGGPSCKGQQEGAARPQTSIGGYRNGIPKVHSSNQTLTRAQLAQNNLEVKKVVVNFTEEATSGD